jgi:hypothetical protein
VARIRSGASARRAATGIRPAACGPMPESPPLPVTPPPPSASPGTASRTAAPGR